MKTTIKLLSLREIGVILCSVLLMNQSCTKEMNNNPGGTADNLMAAKKVNSAGIFNLVSDTAVYSPVHLDPNLVNAWGIAFSTGGGIWVSSNGPGLSTIYDKDGNTLIPPVVIPGGNPSGQVFNTTTAFIIPSSGKAAKFLFATENGTIAAWAGGDSATIVVDRSSFNAVYKGIELASSGGQWFLYATDFHNGKVDVFDQSFNLVSKPFSDPNIPTGFAPFNVRLLNNNLFLTYAMQDADKHDDVAGPGNGYVDIYKTDGSFVRRFTSTGVLNSPWGLEIQRGDDQGDDNQGNNNNQGKKTLDGSDDYTLLVGNFGDGRINVFNSNGKFLHALKVGSNRVSIDGLWAISYPPMASAYSSVEDRLYFTAGPQGENHSIFGYIQK